MIAKSQCFAFGAITLFSIGLLPVSPAVAQHPGGMARMPMYDTKTEVTLKGTVDDVMTMSGMGPGMMPGMHLMLKTEKETLEVHLGPTAFLTEKKVDLKKGDAIEVVGARVKIGDSDALLAREIRKGEASWVLRDANGRPLWMRMRMSRR
jgi:hypothetical protein